MDQAICSVVAAMDAFKPAEEWSRGFKDGCRQINSAGVDDARCSPTVGYFLRAESTSLEKADHHSRHGSVTSPDGSMPAKRSPLAISLQMLSR